MLTMMPSPRRWRSFSIVVACLAAGCASSTAKKPAPPVNPTSPRACITLSGIACHELLKTLRAAIPPGTARAAAEATLAKYNMPYRYVAKKEPDLLTEPRPSRTTGRLTFGVDDGEWPKRGARGYLVDVYLGRDDLVVGFHVNTLTAP